jgi:multiple sugar transport system ATP-binding protein
MPDLRLSGIAKTFPGGAVAVAGVDLDVDSGELVVLLGPSGCGKSTLLRMVAGIETPTAGRIFIGGRDVTDVPPQARDVGMVFQSYALYPHMTVRDNLGFGLKMRRVPRAAAAARVAAVAESLELTPLLDRKPAQLSGGQRQRVALGRALAREAKVFLLDEPLSNLDVQLRVTTRAEIARLHRALRVPMLYVTHDQEEAMTLGDRIVVLNAGRCLQIGTPGEIYARPATQFVAGFVGSPRMSFVPAEPERRDGRVTLRTGRVALALAPAAAAIEWPAAVVVGIRPEDVVLVTAGAGDLDARVDLVESFGRESLVHLLRDGQEIRALVPGIATVAAGDSVGVRLQRPKLHVFDAGTGARLALTGDEPAAGGRPAARA